MRTSRGSQCECRRWEIREPLARLTPQARIDYALRSAKEIRLLIFSYILFFALPALAWFYLKQKKQMHIGLVALITLVLSSVLVLGVFFLEEKKEERALYAFDLDGSGSFSDEEMTPEAQAAMERWTNDAGRMFIPVVAVVFSGIWLVVNFTTLYIFTPNQRAEPNGTGQPM